MTDPSLDPRFHTRSECRADGCDRSGSVMEGLCVRHRILSLAEHLRDDQDLAELLVLLRDVKVLTPEQHAQRTRDSRLLMVAQSIKDLHRYRGWAADVGATPEQIREAIGETAVEVDEAIAARVVAVFREASVVLDEEPREALEEQFLAALHAQK